MLLRLLKKHYLLLYRVSGYHAVDCDALCLSYSVGPVGCLVLGCCIPPWIVVYYDIGTGEIEARSPCLE